MVHLRLLSLLIEIFIGPYLGLSKPAYPGGFPGSTLNPKLGPKPYLEEAWRIEQLHTCNQEETERLTSASSQEADLHGGFSERNVQRFRSERVDP